MDEMLGFDGDELGMSGAASKNNENLTVRKDTKATEANTITTPTTGPSKQSDQ